MKVKKIKKELRRLVEKGVIGDWALITSIGDEVDHESYGDLRFLLEIAKTSVEWVKEEILQDSVS